MKQYSQLDLADVIILKALQKRGSASLLELSKDTGLFHDDIRPHIHSMKECFNKEPRPNYTDDTLMLSEFGKIYLAYIIEEEKRADSAIEFNRNIALGGIVIATLSLIWQIVSICR